MRARFLAAVAGLVPGLLVFFGSRAVAFATVCDCWSTRMAGTVACLCLALVVGLAVGAGVLDRLAPPAA